MEKKFIHRCLIIIIIITSLLGCVSGEDDSTNGVNDIVNEETTLYEEKEYTKIEDDFLNKYIKLAEYLDDRLADTAELDGEEKTIKEKYFELLHIPENVYELDYNYELVKKIGIDTEDGLGKWYHANASEDYPELNMVTENGDLCFSACGIYNASKFLVDKSEWIRFEESLCPEFTFIKSIFYKEDWYRIFTDSFDTGNIYFEYDNEKIVIGNYNEFPIGFKSAKLIQQIKTNISIWRKYFNVVDIDKRFGFTDLGFLYYDLENNLSKYEIILPGTDKYDTLNTTTTDSINRIYLCLYDEPYKDNRNGHIMILDIENNALYNIHHPYYTEINENDDGFKIFYVVGEDDNIYFQLVTEQAYYVFKITPLWDSVEETEYNPRFIEYYPELQEIWDDL